ncbi:MAG: enoyl-CoA hydratase/isomerase family protein [Clostridiales Family XIII bacterium]|jgi:enoyl-CoA hydratase/carnithine racemase|nr:enoyl-CoA hydratase/isomerase family protein [Clostridiales Family XIII bacterium]
MSLVELTVKDHLALLMMRRAEKKNALNEALLTDLREAWERVRQDDDAWIAIIGGEGDVFCAGADKNFIARSAEGEDFWNRFLEMTQRDPYMTGTVGKPTISAINGSCFGGGVSLALAADFRVVSETAIFRMPEPDMGGLIIDWQGGVPSPILAQLNIGLPLTARRAYETGLVNEICPRENVMDVATDIAQQLLRKPPLAIRKNISMIRMLYAKLAPMDRYSLLDYCTQVGNMLAQTEDWKEAMAFFMERKPPSYQAK